MQETRLIKGDCIIEMQKLIEEGVKVDMILCDLPYGVTNHKDNYNLRENRESQNNKNIVELYCIFGIYM